MKENWTKGPWKADFPVVFQDSGIQVHVALLEDCQACPLTQSAEANAQLIAAAPDLYQALKALLGTIGVIDEPTGEVLDAVNALAKARGEAS